MSSVPKSLLEAAKIDGASDFRILVRIVVPLIRPVLVALAIFTFLNAWNDFLWPLITLSSDEAKTVTLAVAQLSGKFLTQYGMVMAGSVVAFTVPFLVYCFMQKSFVQGIALSGIKG